MLRLFSGMSLTGIRHIPIPHVAGSMPAAGGTTGKRTGRNMDKISGDQAQEFDCSAEACERRLRNLLEVCRHSGYRRMGIGKAIDENREFYEVLVGKASFQAETMRPPVLCYPWMENIIQNHDRFFESLLAALHPTYPDIGGRLSEWTLYSGGRPYPRPWRGRYYADEIMWSAEWVKRNNMECYLAGQENVQLCHGRVLKVIVPDLVTRMDEHRILLWFIRNDNAGLLTGSVPWLANIYMFFLDIWYAFELDVYCQSEGNYMKSYNDFGKEEAIIDDWKSLKSQRVDSTCHTLKN